MDHAYTNKVELQAKVDLLRQDVEFTKMLFDAVSRLLLNGPLLPTLPLKGSPLPLGKGAVGGVHGWLTSTDQCLGHWELLWYRSWRRRTFSSDITGSNALLGQIPSLQLPLGKDSPCFSSYIQYISEVKI